MNRWSKWVSALCILCMAVSLMACGSSKEAYEGSPILPQDTAPVAGTDTPAEPSVETGTDTTAAPAAGTTNTSGGTLSPMDAAVAAATGKTPQSGTSSTAGTGSYTLPEMKSYSWCGCSMMIPVTWEPVEENGMLGCKVGERSRFSVYCNDITSLSEDMQKQFYQEQIDDWDCDHDALDLVAEPISFGGQDDGYRFEYNREQISGGQSFNVACIAMKDGKIWNVSFSTPSEEKDEAYLNGTVEEVLWQFQID